MSDPPEDNVARIKATGVAHDEDQIREALRSCNNNPQEAMQLLMPESPQDVALGTYHIISTQTSSSSYEGDVDMRDTETHPGSGGESDRDSTTVSYSLDEERNIEVEEEEEEAGRTLQFRDSHEEVELTEYPPRPEGSPPRYEDIVRNNRGDSSSPLPTGAPQGEIDETGKTPDQHLPETSSSIEFPLTHYYELEGRVHTDQWSIPYKRDESLAICMMATTKMIREGKHSPPMAGTCTEHAHVYII